MRRATLDRQLRAPRPSIFAPLGPRNVRPDKHVGLRPAASSPRSSTSRDAALGSVGSGRRHRATTSTIARPSSTAPARRRLGSTIRPLLAGASRRSRHRGVGDRRPASARMRRVPRPRHRRRRRAARARRPRSAIAATPAGGSSNVGSWQHGDRPVATNSGSWSGRVSPFDRRGCVWSRRNRIGAGWQRRQRQRRRGLRELGERRIERSPSSAIVAKRSSRCFASAFMITRSNAG